MFLSNSSSKWALVGIIAFACGWGGCAGAPDPGVEVVSVGALVPLTGGQSSLGETVEASLLFAEEIINAELASAEAPWRLQLLIEDSRSDPEEAFEKLRTLAEGGARAVVGPFDTDSTLFTAALADRLSALLLTCAPVPPETELDNGSLVRLMPSLQREVDTIVDDLDSNGIEHVAFVGRMGKGSVAFVDLLADKLRDRGGTVAGSVLYDAFDNNVNDFGQENEDLELLVANAVDTFGAGSVAVVLLAQDEAVQLLEQVGPDSVLRNVRWYGASTLGRLPELLSSGEARALAVETSFTAPLIHELDSNGFRAVKQGIRDRIGRDAPSTAVVAYDALWIAALTLNQVADRGDPILLRASFPSVLDGYQGTTGSFIPDGDGDRASGGYDLWTVQDANGAGEWVRTHTYQP